MVLIVQCARWLWCAPLQSRIYIIDNVLIPPLPRITEQMLYGTTLYEALGSTRLQVWALTFLLAPELPPPAIHIMAVTGIRP